MVRTFASAVSVLSGLAALALAGILAMLPATARAETTACTVVSSLAASINAPGHYCLEQDFDYTGFGAAITIQADDVVFDCNHHSVANTGAPGEYTGIHVSYNRKGVIVRNCTIDAFAYGIFVQSTEEPGATGNAIEDNTVLRSGGAGILVYGSFNRIERNRVMGNTGSDEGQATGIELASMGGNGAANVIRDNVVSDFKPPLPTSFNFNTLGIRFSGNNTEVTGNTVTGLYAPTGRIVEAISSTSGQGQLVARNVVLSPPPLPAPLDGAQSYGIRFYTLPATDNVCRDNVVGHFTSANLIGCLDSINTDF